MKFTSWRPRSGLAAVANDATSIPVERRRQRRRIVEVAANDLDIRPESVGCPVGVARQGTDGAAAVAQELHKVRSDVAGGADYENGGVWHLLLRCA
jgi:hypothetical protein